jgi:hypothetical protein
MTAAMRVHEGDDVHLHARMIVAPVAGVFQPASPGTVTTEGEILVEGQVIGLIEGSGRQDDVVSAFTGFFMGLLAEPGERVRPGQPVAWLHDVDLSRR